jgi:hypothetical protein
MHVKIFMKMRDFWDTSPCSLVEAGQQFRGVYCLHHQGDDSMRLHGAISHEALFFIFDTVRT